MIPDQDNYYWRYAKTFSMIRGRTPSRAEFQASAVGKSWLAALEILEDSPEADATQAAQSTGQAAIAGNWEGQIKQLQAAVSERDAMLKSLQDNFNALQAKEASIDLTKLDAPEASLMVKIAAWFMGSKS